MTAQKTAVQVQEQLWFAIYRATRLVLWVYSAGSRAVLYIQGNGPAEGLADCRATRSVCWVYSAGSRAVVCNIRQWPCGRAFSGYFNTFSFRLEWQRESSRGKEGGRLGALNKGSQGSCKRFGRRLRRPQTYLISALRGCERTSSQRSIKLQRPQRRPFFCCPTSEGNVVA